MTKNRPYLATLDRAPLGFVPAVTREFAFLASSGFVQTEVAPTLVRYTCGDTEVSVYHGRQSYELGFEVTRMGVTYYLGEFVRAADPGAAATYRRYAATSPHAVNVGVSRLADLVKQYGRHALSNDAEYFAALDKQRVTWRHEFAMDVLEQQTRPKANEAFRQGRYAEAAGLFEQIRERLSPVERKKLELARRRAHS